SAVSRNRLRTASLASSSHLEMMRGLRMRSLRCCQTTIFTGACRAPPLATRARGSTRAGRVRRISRGTALSLATGSLMPSISIVMPSLNQGAYVREAIDSVLRQSHSSVELIVVDGGSTDGSVEIIREYDSKLAHWVSEPDGGPADALN